MRMIATWSYVDLAVADLVSVFLRTDFKVVNEMFLALTGSAQRRAVMKAAASALPEQDRKLYEKVLTRIRATEDHRNAFAHSIWAFSAKLPDALLLIDPKDLARQRAAYKLNIRELRDWVRWMNEHPESDADWTTAPAPPEVTPPTAALDQSLIMVYRENDLQRELADAHRAELMVMTLHDAIALADKESRVMLEVLLQDQRSPTS